MQQSTFKGSAMQWMQRRQGQQGQQELKHLVGSNFIIIVCIVYSAPDLKILAGLCMQVIVSLRFYRLQCSLSYLIKR